MGYDTILLSPLSRCNPVQVVLSIQSVSAALSSLQACLNHQSLSLSFSLFNPLHPSPFHFLFFLPRQLLCSFIISLHLKLIPPHSSHAIFLMSYSYPFYHFYILTNSILSVVPPTLLSQRLLHFLLLPNIFFSSVPQLHFSRHPSFNITFVCDCL